MNPAKVGLGALLAGGISGGTAIPGERWLAELRSFWTDVAPGQNVTTVVLPAGPTRFYDLRGRFGQVDDPAFGPAFLSIWLDPRSVVSDLRIHLLGGPEAVEVTAAN